jgi:hypothetical protein
MKHKALLLFIFLCVFPLFVDAKSKNDLSTELKRLQEQTQALQAKINQLQQQMVKPKESATPKKPTKKAKVAEDENIVLPTVDGDALDFHQSTLSVHRPDSDPESLEFYPTALVADEHVVTYIAGTPVVTSPYLGSRPAFDGSDYIVNISSINRDIRLMQQRRRLYRAYESIGYPAPQMPILALSGKVQPVATLGDPFVNNAGDVNLGSGELDLAAVLNNSVEAYLSFAYDESPPDIGGQRLSNSSVELNMGFVNIGNLDKTPFYFTGGQLFVPYGRYASAMVSAPLTMILSRTKARPFILGYKSKEDSGPYAALYGFRSDTLIGNSAAGGLNIGYNFDTAWFTGEFGGSYISSMNDAGGMQFTGSVPLTTFGGFSSINNGSEFVKKIPAAGVHANLNIDRYNFTAEWVGATMPFRPQDLSFNGVAAQPQAIQLEAGVTFIAFSKPSSLAFGYQWSKEALALNLPEQRFAGVFNISIWKDTVESLEYRHDINYAVGTYANGASAPGYINQNTLGLGGASDTLLLQIGVFF